MEVDRIVSVAPEHVRLDQVDEDHTVVELLEQPLRDGDALDVRARRVGLVDVDPREDVADLSDVCKARLAAVAASTSSVRSPFSLGLGATRKDNRAMPAGANATLAPDSAGVRPGESGWRGKGA